MAVSVARFRASTHMNPVWLPYSCRQKASSPGSVMYSSRKKRARGGAAPTFLGSRPATNPNLGWLKASPGLSTNLPHSSHTKGASFILRYFRRQFPHETRNPVGRARPGIVRRPTDSHNIPPATTELPGAYSPIAKAKSRASRML